MGELERQLMANTDKNKMLESKIELIQSQMKEKEQEKEQLECYLDQAKENIFNAKNEGRHYKVLQANDMRHAIEKIKEIVGETFSAEEGNELKSSTSLISSITKAKKDCQDELDAQQEICQGLQKSNKVMKCEIDEYRDVLDNRSASLSDVQEELTKSKLNLKNT